MKKKNEKIQEPQEISARVVSDMESHKIDKFAIFMFTAFIIIFVFSLIILGCKTCMNTNDDNANVDKKVIVTTVTYDTDCTYGPMAIKPITEKTEVTTPVTTSITTSVVTTTSAVSDMTTAVETIQPETEPIVEIIQPEPEPISEPVEVITEPAPIVEPVITDVPEAGSMTYLGNIYITGYVWTGNSTSSGEYPYVGGVAMSRDYGLPYGTTIYIEGLGTYVLNDTGCDYGVVDVFCDSVSACYALTGYANVYVVN